MVKDNWWRSDIILNDMSGLVDVMISGRDVVDNYCRCGG